MPASVRLLRLMSRPKLRLRYSPLHAGEGRGSRPPRLTSNYDSEGRFWLQVCQGAQRHALRGLPATQRTVSPAPPPPRPCAADSDGPRSSPQRHPSEIDSCEQYDPASHPELKRECVTLSTVRTPGLKARRAQVCEGQCCPSAASAGEEGGPYRRQRVSRLKFGEKKGSE